MRLLAMICGCIVAWFWCVAEMSALVLCLLDATICWRANCVRDVAVFGLAKLTPGVHG